MDIREKIKQKLVAIWEKKYLAELAQKKTTYEQWIVQKEKQMHQKALDEEAAVVFVRVGDGVLAAGAEEKVKAYFAQHPEAVIVYGDEDVWDFGTGKRSDPWFKPDWSPDTFLSSFYFGGTIAIRREWLKKIYKYNNEADLEKIMQGSGRELAEKIKKLVVEAGGFERGTKSIGHISQILFHSVSKEQQEKMASWSMGTKERNTRVDGDSLISVIIPSKDHPQILFQGLEALFRTKGDCNCEVVVVDNGSSEENRLQIEAFLRKFPVSSKYVYQPMEFNFSRMCNLGAKEASGDILLFLNDDVEAANPGWIERMAYKAAAPYVGAVGLKLLYPGGQKIQHAGIVNLLDGPMHKLLWMEDNRDYYGFNKIDRNVLAVTGACLMIQKEKYMQVSGMNEDLRVTYNDVDLCFRLWELGYHNVVVNTSFAYHHESLSRGEDRTLEMRKRLMKEQKELYDSHPGLKGRDPYYSSEFNDEVWDPAIRPIFMTSGNRMQKTEFREKTVDISQYRRDACLLFSLQKCNACCIQGYGVVLGDNNACYERKLLLWKQEEKQEYGKIHGYCVNLEGQYRPDLEENMADQVHVALCGFWVNPEKLPAGEYHVGILAESRVSGIRLWNESKMLYEHK